MAGSLKVNRYRLLALLLTALRAQTGAASVVHAQHLESSRAAPGPSGGQTAAGDNAPAAHPARQATGDLADAEALRSVRAEAAQRAPAAPKTGGSGEPLVAPEHAEALPVVDEVEQVVDEVLANEASAARGEGAVLPEARAPAGGLPRREVGAVAAESPTSTLLQSALEAAGGGGDVRRRAAGHVEMDVAKPPASDRLRTMATSLRRTSAVLRAAPAVAEVSQPPQPEPAAEQVLTAPPAHTAGTTAAPAQPAAARRQRPQEGAAGTPAATGAPAADHAAGAAADPRPEVADATPLALSTLVVRHWLALLVLLGAALASVVGSTCLAAGICVSSVLRRRVESGEARRTIERLPICSASEVENILPMAGGYDCAISRPLSSRKVLRVEARVQHPASGSLLTAPLTQQGCVIYSTVVTRQLHDGMRPPVAMAFASVDFCVALEDDQSVRINVQGSDVSLFDMCAGQHTERKSYHCLPDKWHDFIERHRVSPHLTRELRSDGATLEFQECTLLVGARVTLAGELHRSADGELSLRPWAGRPSRSQVQEPGFTSWETGVTGGALAAQPAVEGRCDKVLVCDDPVLFGGSLYARARGLCCGRSSLLRKCPRIAGAVSLISRAMGSQHPKK